MQNKQYAELLFGARDENKNAFDFSYTTKLQELQQRKNDRQQKIDQENKKIEGLQNFLATINKKDGNNIYQQRIQECEENKEKYTDHIDKITKEQELYLSVQNQDTIAHIDKYIAAKKQSIRHILSLEKENRLQTISSVQQSIQEPEQQLIELFGNDEELLKQINTDKSLLFAEKEYKLRESDLNKLDMYDRLIHAREKYSAEHSHNDEIENLPLQQKIEIVYTNVIKDYLFFAEIRDPQILDQFCKAIKEYYKTAPDSIKVSDLHDAITSPAQNRNEFNKKKELSKQFKKISGSDWKQLAITAIQGANLETSKQIESFLNTESTEDEEYEQLEKFVKEKTCIDIATLRSANDYMKAIAHLPQKIESKILLPYMETLLQHIQSLEQEKQVYNRHEIYDRFAELFEEQGNFFGKLIEKFTKHISSQYHYIFIPLLTEIFVTTCMVAIGRYQGGPLSSLSKNSEKLCTMRAEVLCEEAAIKQTDRNPDTDRIKINLALKMLNKMERGIDNEKEILKLSLESEKNQEERKKIQGLIQSYERDAYMNDVFKQFYNYFTGSKNISNIYHMLFEFGNKGFSQTQREKVGDLYFQNIDRTEVPYDDPIALMPDTFLMQQTKNDFAFEVNRVNDENYKGMLKISNFDAFAEEESALNAVRKALEITHRETKIQDVTSKLGQDEGDLIIRNFFNYAVILIHTNGSFSINGHSDDGIRVLIGEEEYHILRTYIYRYLLETTNTIDKRDVVGPEQLLPQVPSDDENFHRKDPRVVYDNNSAENPLLRKILDYRDDHRRLLAANMLPGVKGFNNAKQYQQPLYAHIYPIHADARIDNPQQKIRIDEVDTYQEMFAYCKKLREEHTTDTTIIRFETYVQEFTKDEEVDRVTRMNTVGRGIGGRIEQTLDSLTVTA